MLDQAGVEHVPRRQADAAAHHQREADAVQHQADHELRQPPAEPARTQLGDRAQLGEGRGRGATEWSSCINDPYQWPEKEIATCDLLACMSQSISASRVATLVGDFRRSPAYAGLADRLRELIGDGRIGYGTRLPSERDLTAALGVSRTTVTRAYAVLRDSGYAEARHGSGTFTRLPGGPIRALDRALWPTNVSAGVIDLVCAAASAPPGIAAAYADAAAALPAHLGGHGYYPAGLPDLQARIAASYDDRGLPTSPDQIIVTTGALAASAIVGKALAGPRDRVLMESPTYPNAVQALRSGGGRLATMPLDPDGWDLDAIGGVLAKRSPRLVHVMPDHHNPTGLVMPDRERAATPGCWRSTAPRRSSTRPTTRCGSTAPRRSARSPPSPRRRSPSAAPARASGAASGWAGSGRRTHSSTS